MSHICGEAFQMDCAETCISKTLLMQQDFSISLSVASVQTFFSALLLAVSWAYYGWSRIILSIEQISCSILRTGIEDLVFIREAVKTPCVKVQ